MKGRERQTVLFLMKNQVSPGANANIINFLDDAKIIWVARHSVFFYFLGIFVHLTLLTAKIPFLVEQSIESASDLLLMICLPHIYMTSDLIFNRDVRSYKSWGDFTMDTTDIES